MNMESAPSGILLIRKPPSFTSHDIVNVIRKQYNTRQVGHTGTLDPMAEGLLVVLVGRAVKASDYAVGHDKTYRAELLLGLTTDTEDVTGAVLSRADRLPSEDEVRNVLPAFVGEIRQTPPMYSAIKQNGEPLYKLARRGVTVEREPRTVAIRSLTGEPIAPAEGRYALTVVCSKGTYIRTLCADIGRALGYGGVMAALTRTAVGPFSLADAVAPEALKDMTDAEREARLLPVERLFTENDALTMPAFYAHLAASGCEIYLKKLGVSYPVGTRLRLYDEKNEFFAFGEVREYESGPAVKSLVLFRI